jgi:RNA polymerase sigma factor (sigma-70 family)
MADATKDRILRYIRQLSGKVRADGVTDGELLCRFVTGRDEAAFELLLWRYASLVRHVCRNVTRDHHDAEDAFQATFLVLARKAWSVRKGDALGAWLYRVAYRIALRARCQAVQRAAQEKRGLDLRDLPGNDPMGEAEKELRPLLIEEVNRLPAQYRTPIILCYLQGKTLDEAALSLGWPKGTVSGRLARARDMLRGRLLRRGLMTPVGAMIAALSPGETAARTLAFRPVVQAALRFAGHGFRPTPPLPPQSVLLAEGVLRTMHLTKLKGILAAVLTTVVLGSGAC